MNKLEEFKESIRVSGQKRLEEDPHLVFAGALAVSKEKTLLGEYTAFNNAMRYFQKNCTNIPSRFVPILEAFDTRPGRYGNYYLSEKADFMFGTLVWRDPTIHWAWVNGDYSVITHIMPDEMAKMFIEKEGLSPEELNWLWKFAQKMHAFPDKPIFRRGFAISFSPSE